MHIINLVLTLVIILCCQLNRAEASVQQSLPLKGSVQGPVDSGSEFTLEDLEKITAQHNPTLVQANANIQAAKGRARQSGMMPNPVIGFQGDQFAFRALNAKSAYFGFVEQTIPLGGKLKKSRRIYNSEAQRAEIEASAQHQRTVNAVRAVFYEALGAQQQVLLHTELSRIAHDAVTTTKELFNIGQADRPDSFVSEIEAEQVDHELVVARNHLQQVWQVLASIIGVPDMRITKLIGSLEERIPAFDENKALANILQNSPQVKAAESRIQQTRAIVIRAKAEPIPDLFLRGGLGYSTEFVDTTSTGNLKRTGLEANLQAGFSIPVWNRNQGAITSAQSDLAYAQSELTRLKLQLRLQFASATQNHKNALDAIQRYRAVIIPRADQAYEMYLVRFKQMGASYPQVIIAQRTLFQVQKQYINALVQLQQVSTQLEGFLLSGGLDAPQLSDSSGNFNNFVQHAETEGVRSGTDNALDTAGLIEY